VDEQVKLLARGKGYSLFLTPTESVMVPSQQDAALPINEQYEESSMTLIFSASQQIANSRLENQSAAGPLLNTESAPIKQSDIQMKLEGVNFSPTVNGIKQLPNIASDVIGNDSAK